VTPEALSEYRVTARNTFNVENRIHDDEEARRHGFRGALVPGVRVYAYLTRPLVEALGPPWLQRGTAALRLREPVLDGEEVVVRGAITAREAGGLIARLTASTAAGGECATLEATLPAGTPTPLNLAQYPEAPLPAERLPPRRASWESLAALGTPVARYDAAGATEYLEGVSDGLPLYRGPDGWMHPAFLLHQANRAIDRNVRVGPWIHTASVVRHLGGARVGETLRTRGRVRSLFERKGRELVEVDLAIVAGERARPVAHVLHTAIYRLPPPSP
jgi:acyl dehydratase